MLSNLTNPDSHRALPSTRDDCKLINNVTITVEPLLETKSPRRKRLAKKNKKISSSSSSSSSSLTTASSLPPGVSSRRQQFNQTQSHDALTQNTPKIYQTLSLKSPQVQQYPGATSTTRTSAGNIARKSSTQKQDFYLVKPTRHVISSFYMNGKEWQPEMATASTMATTLKYPSSSLEMIPNDRPTTELPSFHHSGDTNTELILDDTLNSAHNDGLPVNDEKSKQAAQLATRFINFKLATGKAAPNLQRTKKPLQNFSQTLPELCSGSILERQLMKNSARIVDPSVETMVRAQHARANLELHFDFLAAYQEFSLTTCSDPKNEEKACKTVIHNVYNPLQTIRNRRTRLALGRLDSSDRAGAQMNAENKITSVLSFTSNNYWTIDSSELVLDYSWRCQFYHLMKCSKGYLIYPEHHDQHLKEREIAANLKRAFLHRNLKQPLSSASSSKGLMTPKMNKVNEIGLKHVDLHPKIGSHEVEQIQQQHVPDPDGGYQSSKYDDTTRSVDLYTENHHSTPASSFELTRAKSASPSGGASLNELHTKTFPSILTKLEAPSTAPSTSNKSNHYIRSQLHSNSQHPCEVETIANASSDLKFLILVFLLRHLSLSNREGNCYYRNSYVQAATREREAKQVSSSFNSKVRCAQRDIIPCVKSIVSNLESQIQTLRRTWLSTTSTRIDKLLVDSDRTTANLSTTLNLEIKQLSERLDSLERCVSSSARCKYFIIHLGYNVLEYTLLIIMWIAWILVSLILCAKDSFKLVLCSLKWLLWC